MSDFETFWDAYPRRVAKGHARTAFEKAIRKTDLATMLAAITDYIRFKPERIDFKHPATWLNGECWSDEWQSVPKQVTNRPRNFVDAAMDRINGRRDAGNNPDAQCLPDGQQQPGSDAGHVRIGYGVPFASSRH